MLGKLLITTAVVIAVYFALRARGPDSQGNDAGKADARSGKPRLVNHGAIKMTAYALLATMLVGSAFYLVQSWEQRREVVRVDVVNPYNGRVQAYRARRGDIDDRTFVTLDGRRIRIAETERLVIGASR
jgi:hypothetical protein